MKPKPLPTFFALLIVWCGVLFCLIACQKESDAKISAASAANSSSGSTIVYTDIAPDSSIHSGHSFALDLDKDGVIDFTLNKRF